MKRLTFWINFILFAISIINLVYSMFIVPEIKYKIISLFITIYLYMNCQVLQKILDEEDNNEA